eukprot:RCo017165
MCPPTLPAEVRCLPSRPLPQKDTDSQKKAELPWTPPCDCGPFLPSPLPLLSVPFGFRGHSGPPVITPLFHAICAVDSFLSGEREPVFSPSALFLPELQVLLVHCGKSFVMPCPQKKKIEEARSSVRLKCSY